MNTSFPVQYYSHKGLIEKRKKWKKCAFCEKNVCVYREAVKALETEMRRKAFFFSIQSDVSKWWLKFRGETKHLNLKALL